MKGEHNFWVSIWEFSQYLSNYDCKDELFCDEFQQGARKLTGENLKVVWAEFSTLS
jgi:hypothetical protein